jgi:hypothetical protein
MRKTILAVCMVLAGLHQAAAQPVPAPGMGGPPPCYAAKLRNSSGMFLSLTNGLRFQVIPGAGRTAVSIWLPLDRLRVCRGNGGSYLITNLSGRNAKTVTALRMYN